MAKIMLAAIMIAMSVAIGGAYSGPLVVEIPKSPPPKPNAKPIPVLRTKTFAASSAEGGVRAALAWMTDAAQQQGVIKVDGVHVVPDQRQPGQWSAFVWNITESQELPELFQPRGLIK